MDALVVTVDGPGKLLPGLARTELLPKASTPTKAFVEPARDLPVLTRPRESKK